MRYPLVCVRFSLLVYVLDISLLLAQQTNCALHLGLRSNIIKLHFQDKTSPQERAYVSALCGGISGGVVTRLMGTFPP